MLHRPGFHFVKKTKRFVILSSDKSSERNLSSFFDIKNPRRTEHLQSEEPFSSDPYFNEMPFTAWKHIERNRQRDRKKYVMISGGFVIPQYRITLKMTVHSIL